MREGERGDEHEVDTMERRVEELTGVMEGDDDGGDDIGN